LLLSVTVFLAPGLAHAEVMEKEPAAAMIWTWALVGGGVAALAWRFRVWLGLIAVTPAALFFAALWSEILDPYVGPAIREEGGTSYVTSAVLATAFIPALIFAVRRRRAPAIPVGSPEGGGS